MKNLVLIRHSKTEFGSLEIPDFDRKLTSTGIQDSRTMGRELFEFAGTPDVFLSSNAERAKTTSFLVAEEIGFNKEEIIFMQDLYLAREYVLTEIIKDLPSDCSIAVIVCHNPGITDLVNNTCFVDIFDIPTTGIACISLDINEWKEFKPGAGSLDKYLYP